VIDKGIKLTWTLKENYDFASMHMYLIVRRADIERRSGLGEGEKERVSNLLVRALRRMKWPPRMSADDQFHQAYFYAIIKLQELGVHQEIAEEIFRTRCHDLESWGGEEGWAAVNLSTWLSYLLHTALRPEAKDRRTALVGQVKEVAARVVPLLGGPWGTHAEGDTRYAWLAGP
jgi:hypothetical protein